MRSKIILTLITIFIFATSAHAQMKMHDKRMQKGKPAYNVTKRDPMHKFMHIVHHLPDMREKLSLTDEQLEKLREIQIDYLKKEIDREAEIKKRRIDLKMLLEREAPVSDVRKTMKSIYDIELEMRVAIYETAKRMISILTEEQRDKLRRMGSEVMKCEMMRDMDDGKRKEKGR